MQKSKDKYTQMEEKNLQVNVGEWRMFCCEIIHSGGQANTESVHVPSYRYTSTHS